MRTAYEAGREAQRRLLLDAASDLLETEGTHALSMRRIAGQAGCSTSVLCSRRGAEAGLAEALWCEGFVRLHAATWHLAGANDQRPAWACPCRPSTSRPPTP